MTKGSGGSGNELCISNTSDSASGVGGGSPSNEE